MVTIDTSGSFVQQGSTIGAIHDYSKTICNTGYNEFTRGVWYKYEPKEDRIVTVAIQPARGFTPRVEILSGTSCTSSVCVETAFTASSPYATFQADKTLTYFILVKGAYSFDDAGTFSMSVTVGFCQLAHSSYNGYS